jgi:hypothetical protein
MLWCTSFSLKVSTSPEGVVARNMPARGAMMNRRINAPRSVKIRYSGWILFNY